MSFGKRQSGFAAAAPAFNTDIAVAHGQAATETAEATGHPFRWLIMLVACGAMLYGLVASYGPDILRDHRLAGTWQPAYDLRATEGKCERTNFVVTFCSAKIKSVARPDDPPSTHRFLMFFASGGGEALAPVRSTIDRNAVSIFYAAETKLRNRTLSFIFSAGILALFTMLGMFLFWRAANSFSP